MKIAALETSNQAFVRQRLVWTADQSGACPGMDRLSATRVSRRFEAEGST